MTHEQSNYITKKAFAAALHKALEEKPFDRITVSEIIDACEVNRKTFYYHFVDLFDLLRWMMEEEAILVFEQHDILNDYSSAISFIIDYIEKNDTMLLNIIETRAGDEIHRFFFNHFLDIADNIIRDIEKIADVNLNDVYREYLCQFYCNAVAGMMIYWIKNKDGRDRIYAEKTITEIIISSLTAIISQYKKGDKNG